MKGHSDRIVAFMAVYSCITDPTVDYLEAEFRHGIYSCNMYDIYSFLVITACSNQNAYHVVLNNKQKFSKILTRIGPFQQWMSQGVMYVYTHIISNYILISQLIKFLNFHARIY